MIRNAYFPLVITLTALMTISCSGGDDLADAYGNFEAQEVVLSAETSGKVLEVLTEEGQRVTRDQILAVVDTTDLLLKADQLISQRASIVAQLGTLEAQAAVFHQQEKNLERDLVRVKRMKEDGAATQKQLDDILGGISLAEKQAASVRAQRAAILAQADGLDAQLEQIHELRSRSSIRSPIDGTILTIFTEAGELAAPGKALFKLADLDQMILRVYVSGAQLSALQIGQEAEVSVDTVNESLRTLKGSISRIAGEAEFTPRIIQTREERVNMVYAVEIMVVNDGSLKIGMPAEVMFKN